MHDIRSIRDNPEAFDHALARRGLAPEAKRLIALDEKRRAKIFELETAQARRNAASKEIGEAKKSKNEEKAAGLFAEVADAERTRSRRWRRKKRKPPRRSMRRWRKFPICRCAEVPDGKDEHGNVEHHRFGAKREYSFTPKQHFELGEALGQMDFETAAKLSGARFVVLKKGLARLERALGQFFLDVHTSEPHNYTEVSPPLLVRDEAMFGTAQLPKFEDDQFQVLSAGFEGLMAAMTAKVAQRLPFVQSHYKEIFGRDMSTQEAIEISRCFDRLENLSTVNLYEMETEDDRIVAGSSPPPKCR